MVSTCPHTSKSSSFCTMLWWLYRMLLLELLLTSLSCSIGFWSLTRSKYLSFVSLSLLSTGTAKSSIRHVIFFFLLLLLLNIIRSGHPDEIRWSVYKSRSQRIFYISFSWTDSWLCIYHLFVWSNLNVVYNCKWITFDVKPFIILYSLPLSLCLSVMIYYIRLFCS